MQPEVPWGVRDICSNHEKDAEKLRTPRKKLELMEHYRTTILEILCHFFGVTIRWMVKVTEIASKLKENNWMEIWHLFCLFIYFALIIIYLEFHLIYHFVGGNRPSKFDEFDDQLPIFLVVLWCLSGVFSMNHTMYMYMYMYVFLYMYMYMYMYRYRYMYILILIWKI